MLFFNKKEFLADHFEGIIDIHNHILPAIDDGSKDAEMSLQMIELYKELGFKGCIATPHTMEDYYGNDVSTIHKAFSDFIKKDDSFIKNAASEYMIDGNFESLIDSNQILFLKERILLTEFSYFQKPDHVNELLFKLIQKDITPILAHPERYRYIKDLEEYKDLKERGFLFQLNLLALSGHYGKDALAKSTLLLKNELYDFIGTDAHKPEHLKAIKEIKISKSLLEAIKPVLQNTKNSFN